MKNKIEDYGFRVFIFGIVLGLIFGFVLGVNF